MDKALREYIETFDDVRGDLELRDQGRKVRVDVDAWRVWYKRYARSFDFLSPPEVVIAERWHKDKDGPYLRCSEPQGSVSYAVPAQFILEIFD